MRSKLFGKGWIILLTIFFVLSATAAMASQTKKAKEIERISVEKARANTQSGKAILVCAYNDKKCKEILLEGAILRSEFESKLSSLPKTGEIIFYCQ